MFLIAEKHISLFRVGSLNYEVIPISYASYSVINDISITLSYYGFSTVIKTSAAEIAL